MKVYFPDDPIKQEMIKSIVHYYKVTKKDDTVSTITIGEKIEEVLK